MATGAALRLALLLGGALAAALLAPGCAASPVRELCEAARLSGRADALARCAALRASSWRSSSGAAAGRRGILGMS